MKSGLARGVMKMPAREKGERKIVSVVACPGGRIFQKGEKHERKLRRGGILLKKGGEGKA